MLGSYTGHATHSSPPRYAPHNPWRTSLICTGRGFGKTRAGAEWVCGVARAKPAAQIALVGANLAKVRNVMGEAGSGVRGRSTAMLPGQAQKEFTLNESLARIDLLLHPEVAAERGDPLADPEVDASYLVAPQATGDSSGERLDRRLRRTAMDLRRAD